MPECRDKDPQSWPTKTGFGALCLKRKEILKVYKMNNLDSVKSLLFCFHTFDVRRAKVVLDSENKPGSGALEIKRGRLDTKSIKTKKKSLIITHLQYIIDY